MLFHSPGFSSEAVTGMGPEIPGEMLQMMDNFGVIYCCYLKAVTFS